MRKCIQLKGKEWKIIQNLTEQFMSKYNSTLLNIKWFDQGRRFSIQLIGKPDLPWVVLRCGSFCDESLSFFTLH